MDKVKQLLAQRGDEYGPAWIRTGLVIDMLNNGEGGLQKVIQSHFFYAWVTILCKLIRLMQNPNHLDSWDDIAGYATLVSTELHERGKIHE